MKYPYPSQKQMQKAHMGDPQILADAMKRMAKRKWMREHSPQGNNLPNNCDVIFTAALKLYAESYEKEGSLIPPGLFR
jgi:hypothetical protein